MSSDTKKVVKDLPRYVAVRQFEQEFKNDYYSGLKATFKKVIQIMKR